jgi:hypothetical protein
MLSTSDAVGTLLAIYTEQKLNTDCSYREFIQEEERNMGRMRENPRYNVISMRISDEERAVLEEVMHVTSKSVSQLMREAMEMIQHQSHQQINRKAA